MRLLALCGLLGAWLASAQMDAYDDLDGSQQLYRSPPPPAGIISQSCRFTPPGSFHSFDLSGMQRLDHDFTSTTAGGYAYRFNVCGNTVKVCNQLPAPASKWRGTKCNNLGDAETMRIALLDEAKPAKGLRLSYDQGDICKKNTPDGGTEMGSRFISYEITCNPAETPGKLVEIREVSMCEYVILFESAHACPVHVTRANGPTSLLFWFIFSFAAYCAIGIAYNKYMLNAQGLDLIPNRAMWEEVPGLVKEGAAFSAAKGKDALQDVPSLVQKTVQDVPALVDKLKQKVQGATAL